jgi:hypothetical protein
MSLIPALQTTPFTDFGNTIYQTAYGDTILTINPDATLTLQNTNTGNIMTFSSDNFDYNGTSVDYSRLNALRAVCPSVNPTILGVNHTISLQNNDVIGSADHTINISSGDPANVGEHFGIEYYSTTNDDFVLSSSTSGSLVYKQISGTTDELRLNPQQVYLYNNITLANEYLDITKSRIYMENKLGGGGNETLISIDCEDGTGHPRESITLYETSTIIRDDYIKIGNKSYNTAINSGDLYCNNVTLNTINGLAPTTIGLTWGNFTGIQASINLPENNGYSLDSGSGTSSFLNAGFVSITDTSNSKTFVGQASNLTITNTASGENSILSSTDLIFNAGATNNISATSSFTISAPTNITINSSSGNTEIGDTNNIVGHDCIIQVDPATDTIVLNAYNINTYGWSMPICFTTQQNSSISYTFGGQNWEQVYNTAFNIPPEFVSLGTSYTSTRWKVDFTLNTYNNSNMGDKGLGVYFDLWDVYGHQIVPYAYNQNTPYTMFKQFGYANNGNQPFIPYTWSDIVDLNVLVSSGSNTLDLRLYFAGDSGFSCNFYLVVSFTKTNGI